MKEARNITSPSIGETPLRPFNPGLGANGANAERIRPAVRPAADAFSSDFSLENSTSENGFNFSGVDSLGAPVKGFVQTTEGEAAARELARAGIVVESIRERRGGRKKNRRPTSIELATLAEQFGDLMEIGESPTQVCRLLSFAQTNTVLAEALLNAGELVLNGRSLSEAFSAQTDGNGKPLFPITFICALRIGEEVGSSADSETGKSQSAFLLTLKRFAEGEKKAAAIRSKIRSAMMYPVAVIGFCFIASGLILYYVMPKMVELYSSLLTGQDTQLPLITRILIGASDFLTSWWGLLTVLVCLLGAIVLFRWSKTPDGGNSIKTASLRMPVFGSFFRLFYAAQTLRTLAMLSAGIPSLSERFLIAAETSVNPEYSKMLLHVRHRFLTESTDLHQLFVPYPFLMGKEFGGVLMTFEKTADMQGTFHNYARVVETRAERELEGVLFWLQNFAIVPVGIFVAFILVALYSPMFTLAERIGK